MDTLRHQLMAPDRVHRRPASLKALTPSIQKDPTTGGPWGKWGMSWLTKRAQRATQQWERSWFLTNTHSERRMFREIVLSHKNVRPPFAVQPAWTLRTGPKRLGRYGSPKPNPLENPGARRVEQDYKFSADFALWWLPIAWRNCGHHSSVTKSSATEFRKRLTRLWQKGFCLYAVIKSCSSKSICSAGQTHWSRLTCDRSKEVGGREDLQRVQVHAAYTNPWITVNYRKEGRFLSILCGEPLNIIELEGTCFFWYMVSIAFPFHLQGLKLPLRALLGQAQARRCHRNGLDATEVSRHFQQETAEGFPAHFHGILGGSQETKRKRVRMEGVCEGWSSQDKVSFVKVKWNSCCGERPGGLHAQTQSKAIAKSPKKSTNHTSPTTPRFIKRSPGSKCSKVGKPKIRGCLVRMGKGWCKPVVPNSSPRARGSRSSCAEVALPALLHQSDTHG